MIKKQILTTQLFSDIINQHNFDTNSFICKQWQSPNQVVTHRNICHTLSRNLKRFHESNSQSVSHNLYLSRACKQSLSQRYRSVQCTTTEDNSKHILFFTPIILIFSLHTLLSRKSALSAPAHLLLSGTHTLPPPLKLYNEIFYLSFFEFRFGTEGIGCVNTLRQAAFTIFIFVIYWWAILSLSSFMENEMIRVNDVCENCKQIKSKVYCSIGIFEL